MFAVENLKKKTSSGELYRAWLCPSDQVDLWMICVILGGEGEGGLVFLVEVLTVVAGLRDPRRNYPIGILKISSQYVHSRSGSSGSIIRLQPPQAL